MSWRYGIFSFLLLAAAVLLALKNFEVWTQPIETLQQVEVRTRKGEPRSEGAMIPGRQQASSLASAIVLSEKNIFNPDRKEFSFTTSEQAKPTGRPQIILYGVTIAADYQAASLVQPGRSLRKGEREMMTLKVGEKVGEYRLAKILPDRITLESGDDSFEVLLYDASAPKKRTAVRTEVKPAEVKSTAPSPAPAPTAAPPVAAPKAAEAPKEPPRERVMEAPLPRPVTPGPAPVPVPSAPSQRRPVRPYTPPGSGTK